MSVIVPTCNSARYIAGTLASVACQSFTDFEVVVADAGSDDDTVDIVGAAADRDDRIRLVRLAERTLPPVTRNAALAEARGEIVALLDSDDQMFPDRLQCQVAALLADPELVAVGSRLVIVDGLGVSTGRELGAGRDAASDAAIRFALAFGLFTLTSGLTARTAALRAVGGFDESSPWADDYSLCVRLLAVGAMTMTDRPAGVYRVHGDQVTTLMKDPQNLEVALLRQRIIAAVLGRKPSLSTVLAWSYPVAHLPDGAREQAIADLDEYHAAFVRSRPMSGPDASAVYAQYVRRRARLAGEPDAADGDAVDGDTVDAGGSHADATGSGA